MDSLFRKKNGLEKVLTGKDLWRKTKKDTRYKTMKISIEKEYLDLLIKKSKKTLPEASLYCNEDMAEKLTLLLGYIEALEVIINSETKL